MVFRSHQNPHTLLHVTYFCLIGKPRVEADDTSPLFPLQQPQSFPELQGSRRARLSPNQCLWVLGAHRLALPSRARSWPMTASLRWLGLPPSPVAAPLAQLFPARPSAGSASLPGARVRGAHSQAQPTINELEPRSLRSRLCPPRLAASQAASDPEDCGVR